MPQSPSPLPRERQKTVFLVNPASDNGATGKRWPELAHRAAALGLAGDALLSERPNHLTELAHAAADSGAGLVVAVGGDGTVNEIVNGLMRAEPRPELAVVPLGTGKDFVRTHGIPSRFDDAVRTAAGGATRTIDVGHARYRTWHGNAETRFFANVGSVGMSGAVAQRANSMSKALGGRATFFYALVRVFFSWRNTEVTVELAEGDRRVARMHDVVAANGQYHGGGMWLAPEADPADGLLDVLLIGDIAKPDFIRSVPRIYRGTHLSHPKVELLRSRRVSVDAPERLPIELDGEQVGTTPIEFGIVPSALRLRAPRSASSDGRTGRARTS